MRWYEVIGMTEEEWLASSDQSEFDESYIDIQNKRADQLMKQGRIEKKMVQLSRAEQETVKRRQELASLRTDHQKGR